jgi:hypothetical protein
MEAALANYDNLSALVDRLETELKSEILSAAELRYRLANEWVSVEDRLPEVGQEVLVYWRNTSQKAEHFELTHYDGDHWFLLDNTERPWIVVVAWMLLPAPPDRRPPEGEEDA